MYDKILARRIMKLIKEHLNQVVNDEVNHSEMQRSDVTVALSLLDLFNTVIRLDEILLIN